MRSKCFDEKKSFQFSNNRYTIAAANGIENYYLLFGMASDGKFVYNFRKRMQCSECQILDECIYFALMKFN